MCFGVLVIVRDVTVSGDDAIPTTALSHLGGGLSERSEWLPQVSRGWSFGLFQWERAGAPSRSSGRLGICI